MVSAGNFGGWVDGLRAALRGEASSDVPCGDCTACCTSSQFIHIAPDETDTLAHIPSALLFPAPRLPRGNVLLGYNERGHCPMLVDNACSIYEHRPRTCRTYDCRIFPAAEVAPEESRPLIAQRAREWLFSYPSADDRVRHEAVRAAAAFLRRHLSELPPGAVPTNATQLAVLAFGIHEAFRATDDMGRPTVATPDLATVAAWLDTSSSHPTPTAKSDSQDREKATP
jgi:uncharacterized protein